jgi:hypothetical protein
MAYEQRDGQGSLFKNDEKKTDKHPDYRGDCMIDGKKFWLSAWIKTGKNGKFMSLAIQPKEENGKRQAGKQQEDSEIPF